MNRPITSAIVAFILLIGWHEALTGTSIFSGILYFVIGIYILYVLALSVDTTIDMIVERRFKK